MDISFIELVMISLASFRLTRLIVFDKITEFIRSPFFVEEEEVNEFGETEVYYVPKKGGLKGFLGELLSCYWCTGIWSATFLCILYMIWPSVTFPILLILSTAAIAAIIEALIQRIISE
ncbi:DUF1360 domain-containing protein [Cytobacillus sp. FJAT-54145]|uniref:DUF1360 domain-containing protein n=1 Tax=Cytobacillus spartinae TaxID=3299023 RepID=A0ABW6K8C6_9BACI